MTTSSRPLHGLLEADPVVATAGVPLLADALSALVARGLERQLEEHLTAQLKLQEDYRRYRAERPVS